jgi:putative ABC transport system ATP-binding protein
VTVVDGVRSTGWRSAAAVFRRAPDRVRVPAVHLLDDLTVRENVEVAALLAGRSRREARSTADELLAQLGMTDRAGRLPASLSGGERQRVAIARAIVNRPAILLADEPTGALDRHAGQGALALLEDLNRRGQTMVIVTHDRELAERHAHRIVELVDGTVVRDRPASRAA